MTAAPTPRDGERELLRRMMNAPTGCPNVTDHALQQLEEFVTQSVAEAVKDLADLREGRACVLPQTQQHARHLYTVAVACLKTFGDDPESARDAAIDREHETTERILKAEKANTALEADNRALRARVAQIMEIIDIVADRDVFYLGENLRAKIAALAPKEGK